MAKDKTVLRTSLPVSMDIRQYDPATFQYYYEYVLLEHIHSPLVRYSSSKRRVVADASNKFYWKGDSLYFEFKGDRITSKGYAITAQDAYFSILRVMVMGNKNAHINLQDILCKEKSINSLASSCSGLAQEKNLLILTPRIKKELLFESLMSIDFAIIPRKNFDDRTLEITNFSDTYGPYYYDSKNPNGALVLKKNLKHWAHLENSNSPDEILIFEDKHIQDPKLGNLVTSFELFKNKKIDFIGVNGLSSWKSLMKLEGVTHYKTIENSVVYALFTSYGIDTIPLDKRRMIIKALQGAVAQEKSKRKEDQQSPVQFMIPGGFGSLLKDQISELKDNIDNINVNLGNTIFTIAIPEAAVNFYKHVFRDLLKNFRIISMKATHHFIDANPNDPEVPMLVIGQQDVGYGPSYHNINYLIKNKLFQFHTKEEEKKWWNKYLEADDNDNLQDELVRNIHFRSLFEEATLIPLFSKASYAFSQNGWKLKFSRTSRDSPFWLLEKR